MRVAIRDCLIVKTPLTEDTHDLLQAFDPTRILSETLWKLPGQSPGNLPGLDLAGSLG